MTQTIDLKIIQDAIDLNEEGKIEEAYMLLALQGDNYAAAAYGIVGDGNSVYRSTVINLWENEVPGSVEQSWDEVAAQHQLQYLKAIQANQGVLIDTKAIEDSYVLALEANRLPKSLAIDVVMNTITEANPSLPKWYEILGLDESKTF